MTDRPRKPMPSISDARDLVEQYDADAVLTLTLREAGVGGVSYGRDRRRCRAAGWLVDRIHGDLFIGATPVPDALLPD